VRRFRQDAVPSEILQRVLETATWAPNAHNRQPWRFVQLASPESRQALAGAMGAQFEKVLNAEGVRPAERAAQIKRSSDRLLEAPEAILLCLDTEVLDTFQDEGRTRGEYLMGVQSVALAGGQLLLAAPAEVGQALELPASWQAQGLLLLGYPRDVAVEKERKPINEVWRVI